MFSKDFFSFLWHHFYFICTIDMLTLLLVAAGNGCQLIISVTAKDEEQAETMETKVTYIHGGSP